MPQAVGYISDQRFRLVEIIKDDFDHLKVGLYVASADIVSPARLSSGQDGPNGGAVIVHKQPVPDIHSVAINRQGLVVESVVDHQWDQFLWKLIRAIVVGTPGNIEREAIGVAESANEVIRGGFSCRVGRVGTQGSVFRELAISSQ